MRRFLGNIVEHLLSIIVLAMILALVIIIGSYINSCSSESRAIAKAKADAEHEAIQEAEYERLGALYYRVYDDAMEAYWDLANMYDDLYSAYRDDPGRTGSLDGFLNPADLEDPLCDDVAYYLDD